MSETDPVEWIQRLSDRWHDAVDQLTTELQRKDRKIIELEIVLDNYAGKTVDGNDPFLELEEWCASHLKTEDLIAVELLINDLREHFRLRAAEFSKKL